MTIAVLHLSHRITRDKRITTHLALTARAFGSTEFLYSGDHDSNIEESIEDVCNQWGGNFSITHIGKPLKFIKDWKKNNGIVVHLTMYGIELSDYLDQLRKILEKEILVVVGGAKVPGSIFELSDYNIAIGHQPHSEVAALAVLLDTIPEEKTRKQKFTNAKIEIEPSERGKQTRKVN